MNKTLSPNRSLPPFTAALSKPIIETGKSPRVVYIHTGIHVYNYMFLSSDYNVGFSILSSNLIINLGS